MIHHPLVGDLELTYETMQLTSDSTLSLAGFTAAPGSSSQQSLDILASWGTQSDPTIAAAAEPESDGP